MILIATLAACNRQGFSRPEVQYTQAHSALERGDLISCFKLAGEGRERYRQSDWAARFRLLQAEVLIWQGKFKDALVLLDEPLPQLASTDLIVRDKLLHGMAHYRALEFDKAASELSEAEQLARVKQPDLMADVMLGKGSLALMQRNYKAAAISFESALQMARQQNRVYLQTLLLGNLGVIALQQQHCGEAIDRFTLVQQNAEKLQNQMIAARNLGNLGWCYYTLGDFDRALDDYTQAEAVSARLGAVSDRFRWLNNIGLIYAEQHDDARASAYFRQSLDLARSLGDRAGAIDALSNLALVALETGDLDVAEKNNQEAIRLQHEIGNESGHWPVLNSARIAFGRKQYPEATRLFRKVISVSGDDLWLRWEAESYLAALYASEGRDSVAYLQYKKGLETIDKARSAITSDEQRLSFLNTATQFYNDYIDFLVAHHREREALAVAEHSRARTLAEGLKIPVQLRESAFRPEENARRLNSVVLSYWLKPERSYLWVVTPTRVQLFPLPPQSEIDAAVDDYRKALLGPSQARDSAAGEKLYEMLVAPAEKLIGTVGKDPRLLRAGDVGYGKKVPRVIIIADGSLVNLNFETLMVPGPQPHYWIEDATISSASSIALLRVSTHNGTMARSHDGTMLLIGAPNYAGTDFPELSQAKAEVQKVENYFPANERTVIEGKAAVPSAYDAAKPGEFTYIHFVAHATASRLSPLDSSIILSKQGDAYKLYARDIMQQPLKADLVTISACYGAGNRAYSGEGLVGLSWAFLRAGAHNVIAALWEVNDASTPQLMDHLYRNIGNGEDPATALRHAKLDMLHSQSVYRRPFYWGAFQLYVGS